MATHLYLAPAAGGKTAYILARAREQARDLAAVPRVVVATYLQARAARRRLAEMGGALGVRVLTFDRLFAEILSASGEIYVELSEAVQYRLIRAVVDGLPLSHYAPLADRPGFIQVLQRLIGELKAAHVHPDDLAAAIESMGNEARLAELSLIYSAYQSRLQAQGWADRAGMGWLAAESLDRRAPFVGRNWPFLAVDGFDRFTSIQIALLRALACRVGEVVVTLTGATEGGPPRQVHRRFAVTCAKLAAVLGTEAEPLPHSGPRRGGMARLAAGALETTAPAPDGPVGRGAPEGGETHQGVETPPLPEMAGSWGGGTLPAPEPAPEPAPGPVGEPVPAPAAPPEPDPEPRRAPALAHLERNLFRSGVAPVEAGGAVELVEAPDRAGEVRAALRWLKQSIVSTGHGCRPGEAALLARHIAPYLPFIRQTAAEFGLPIRVVDGLPLRENPAVAALLGLLQLALPGPTGELSLPRRSVVEAWRSPYFAWNGPTAAGSAGAADDVEPEPWPGPAQMPTPAVAGAPIHRTGVRMGIGIAPGDADDLDAVARWGRVIGGQAQWAEALDGLAGLAGAPSDDEDQGVPDGLPRGEAVRALQAKFERFVARVTPPAVAGSYRDFTGWLEDLIGGDGPVAPGSAGRFAPADDPASLRIVAQARAGDAAAAERDVAALAGLKDVLRGLVAAEDALGARPIDYARFVAELTGALDVVAYYLPAHSDREEILVAGVTQARGLPLRAVAVLGLAEGEFPATLGEDPFLRDADRRRLVRQFGLQLDLPTEGAEAEAFYETVTRARDRLLLTRPRLADNGAPWQASAFWEAVRRAVTVEPVRLSSESAPAPGEAASWPELLEGLAQPGRAEAAHRWAAQAKPARTAAVAAAVHVLHQRRPYAGGSPFDGDLAALADECAARFAPESTWSASRLEAYRSCPFAFFVGHVLKLEPRQEPVEGLDARQLGNIYHHIFDRLYGAVAGPAGVDTLLAALPEAAAAVLDEAPRAEGFRVTAWWTQTRAEIADNVRRSVENLAALPGEWEPVAHEKDFFAGDSLVVRDGVSDSGRDGPDTFRLHGYIDRVDRAPDGGLRIIDYKTAGPADFTAKAITDGKKLQLPLYALAAEQALGLGRVTDGFYWHVQQAEASRFTLADFAGGPEGAIQTALAHAWAAVRGARAGRFIPHPPDGGCPDYCPAAAFCWHYRARR